MSPAAPTVTGPAAESLDVKTTDAVFRFTNVGAAPVSVTMLNYNSTRVRSEQVVLTPVVRLLLAGPKDTLDLSKTAFQMQKTGSTVSFTGDVNGSHVDISYAIAPDGYLATMTGKVTGPAASDSNHLFVQLPSTFKSTEVDTVDDQNHFAYAVKRVNDDPQGLPFAKLDTVPHIVPGPLSWVAARNKYFVIGLLTNSAAPFTAADFIRKSEAARGKDQDHRLRRRCPVTPQRVLRIPALRRASGIQPAARTGSRVRGRESVRWILARGHAAVRDAHRPHHDLDAR